MNANGNTRKSKVRPVTPISRVVLKNRHNTPMTSKIKNDINISMTNFKIKKKLRNTPDLPRKAGIRVGIGITKMSELQKPLLGVVFEMAENLERRT
jgi:hypothetical protein